MVTDVGQMGDHAESAGLRVDLVTLELLDDRAERDGREERERPDDEDHADEQADEQRGVGPEGPGGHGHHVLLSQHTTERKGGDHLGEAAEPEAR